MQPASVLLRLHGNSTEGFFFSFLMNLYWLDYIAPFILRRLYCAVDIARGTRYMGAVSVQCGREVCPK